MKTYKELLEKEEGEMTFTVILKGGQIGQKTIKSAAELRGQKPDKKLKIYTDIAAAKEQAKKWNKTLSPGEKSYYGLRYIIARIINGKFTGK